MAYTIVERLKEHNKTDVLYQLAKAVYASDKGKGKIHGCLNAHLTERNYEPTFLYAKVFLYTQ